jgi:sterol desaturase/sphingolipid hydroxylase (fatty acid hydroxylase superfamily)
VIGAEAHVVVVCELVRMLFVLFHHANLSFPGEKWLSYVVITPSLHRGHHSTLRSEHDSNYGIVLSVWDILFGTRKELVPKSIGLELIEAENLVQLFRARQGIAESVFRGKGYGIPGDRTAS